MGNSDHGTTYARIGEDDGELRPWHYIYMRAGGDDVRGNESEGNPTAGWREAPPLGHAPAGLVGRRVAPHPNPRNSGTPEPEPQIPKHQP